MPEYYEKNINRTLSIILLLVFARSVVVLLLSVCVNIEQRYQCVKIAQGDLSIQLPGEILKKCTAVF